MDEKGTPVGASAVEPARKPERRGLLFAIGVGFAVVAVTLGALAAFIYYKHSSGTKPKLAQFAPSQTLAYFEVPSLRGVAWGALKSAKRSALDARLDQQLEQLTHHLSEKFAIEPGLAADLLASAAGVAVAITTTPETTPGAPNAPSAGSPSGPIDAVVLLGFDATAPVEKLLATKFEASEPIGSRPTRRADNQTLLWLPQQAVLAIGERNGLSRVAAVVDGQPSLSSTEGWKTSNFPNGAAAIAWFDATQWQKDMDPTQSQYLRFSGPGTLALEFLDAGVKLSLDTQSKLGKIPLTSMPEPAKLDLYKRLPAESRIFFAYQSHYDVPPDLDQRLKEYTEGLAPEQRQQSEQLVAYLRELGIDYATVPKLLGDQGVLAAISDGTPSLGTLNQVTLLAHYGLVLIQQLRDVPGTKQLLRSLGEKMVPIGTTLGYQVELTDARLSARSLALGALQAEIWIDGEYLFATLGQPVITEHAKAAFTGNHNLASAAPYEKALSILPSANQALAWMDFGDILPALPAPTGSTTAIASPPSGEHPNLGLSWRVNLAQEVMHMHAEVVDTDALLVQRGLDAAEAFNLGALLGAP